jgi:hypothetical protein
VTAPLAVRETKDICNPMLQSEEICRANSLELKESFPPSMRDCKSAGSINSNGTVAQLIKGMQGA